jgi:hypothetical protein
MRRIVCHRPSPAMVVALIALLVALGDGAVSTLRIVLRRWALCALLVFGCALVTPTAAGAAGPTVQPLRITSSSVPFGAMVSGSAPGMSEREYVLRGHARTFTDAGPTGRSPAYATRLLVRRPANFNGTVLVELLNNSAGFEVEPMWDYQRDGLARRGIAWVGVTYDPAAVGFLQSWDPQRYAALGAGLADPSQAWDVVAQVGRLLRHNAESDDLLADSSVRRELLTGYSGPAPTVAAWADHFGADSSAYDGYLIGGSYGNVASLSETSESPGTIHRAVLGQVIRIDTETELVDTQGATRQNDGPRLRTWELAGGSHIDATVGARFGEMWGRDLGLPPITTVCANPVNPLSVGDAMNAARDDLLGWAATGMPAPVADRLHLDASGAIVRDGDGNAVGGLRLPTIAVPTGTLGPSNTPNPNDTSGLAPFCALVGSFARFDHGRLDALYPSHRAYVDRVADRARLLERERFLTAEDAARLTGEARQSDIGKS